MPKIPQRKIRCPNCNYCLEEIGVDYSPSITIEEQLDSFEVMGCLGGEIMCPTCGNNFPWPPKKKNSNA